MEAYGNVKFTSTRQITNRPITFRLQTKNMAKINKCLLHYK